MKRPADLMTTSTPQTLEAHRERFSSFSSVSSEELDALGSELSAHEAAAKNEATSKKKKPHAAADRDDPEEQCINVDHDLDHICHTMYARVEEDTMIDIMNSLQDEMTRVPTETRAELLWDVVATPQMFKEFSETVANGPRVTASA